MKLTRIDFRIDGGLAHLRLNRPEARNAIDLAVAEETLAVAQRIEQDPTVRAVLISGAGPSLTVGGDIKFFESAADGDLGTLLRRMATPFHEAFRILSTIDAPIVTVAHGAIAGGGMGYVWAADIAVAAASTTFVPAFSKLGVTGDGGWSWHLPRRIGVARATNIMLQDVPISAQQAVDWGLIAECVPDDRAYERGLEIATNLAQGPTLGLGGMRRLIRESWDNSLASQMNSETDGLAFSGRTKDMQNAVSSFLRKEAPRFSGN